MDGWVDQYTDGLLVGLVSAQMDGWSGWSMHRWVGGWMGHWIDWWVVGWVSTQMDGWSGGSVHRWMVEGWVIG